MGEGRLRGLKLAVNARLPAPVLRRVSPVQRAQAVCSPAMEGAIFSGNFYT